MTSLYPSFVEDTKAKLGLLSRWIQRCQVVVWFTGAGISTESGLPDFRGPDGIWTRRRKGLPRRRPTTPASQIAPNPAHLAIVEFEKLGKCAFLISQNVDNLHLESGYPIDKLAELHGNKERVRCRPCRQTFAVADIPDIPQPRKLRRGKTFFNACPNCGGTLEDSVINFGDRMPDEDVEASFEWAKRADLMIVVGSTCEVLPAANMPRATKRNGGGVVIMNIGKTGLEDLCDLRFRDEKVGELLPYLLAEYENTIRSSSTNSGKSSRRPPAI